MGRTPPGQTRERVFRFMRQRLMAGMPPTIREVQEHFGFRAVQTAREHLEVLVGEGRLNKQLARRQGKARGYRLPSSHLRGAAEAGPSSTPLLVPLLGRVQAGALTEAVEDPDGYLALHVPPSRNLPNPEDLFGLRVEGESMRDAGILAGDIVIVRAQPTAGHGDIVVALVEDEATVKHLHRAGGRIELHPANPDFQPIVPRPEELLILGKVIEVRRHLEGGGVLG